MAIEIVVSSLRKRILTPRGWLVRVTNAKKTERWFAVGIYSQKIAETTVCHLPQIEPTDVVFAHRRLMPSEIERLGLERRQVVVANSAEAQPLNNDNSKKNRHIVVMQEPRMEVPTELRDLAAKTIDHAEAAFGFFFEAAKKSLVSIPRPALTLSEHALPFIEQNIKAAFDQARKVARATNPQEAIQIQSEFLKSQFISAGETVWKITGEIASGTKDASHSKTTRS